MMSRTLWQLLTLELSFKAFRTLFKGERFAYKHPLDELFDEMGEEAQGELLETLKRLPEASEVTREDVRKFVREFSNAVVDLRYLIGIFSPSSDFAFEPAQWTLLNNLCKACLQMLEERGIKPEEFGELDSPVPHPEH